VRRKGDKIDLSELSVDELATLKHQLQARLKLEQQRSAYWNYAPKPFQEAWWKSEKPIVALLAANQTGKTTFGVIRMIMACTGTAPIALGGRPEQGFPAGILRGKRFLVAGEQLSTVTTKTIFPKLEEYLTPDMLADGQPMPTEATFRDEETVVRFRSGAEMVFMYYTQNRRAFEGAVFDGAWLDEPPRENQWTAIRRGLIAKRGFCVLSATSVDQREAWVVDQVFDPGRDKRHPRHAMVDCFEAEMHDNCAGSEDGSCPGNGGALPHERIVDFERSLHGAEKAARIKGTVASMAGVNYAYVTRETHSIPDFEVPLDWPLVEVIDPSMTRGLWVGTFTRDPDKLWYMIGARHAEDAGFFQMCEEVKRFRRMHRRLPDMAIMDTRGGHQTVDKNRETDWFDEFARHGLNYVPSEGHSDVQLQRLHDWLEIRWQPGKEAELPKLRFFRSVAVEERGPLWALTRFKWDPRNLDVRKEHYTQEAKDWVDVLKYLAGFPGIDSRFREGRRRPSERPTLAESYSRRARRMGHAQESSMTLGRATKSGRYGRFPARF